MYDHSLCLASVFFSNSRDIHTVAVERQCFCCRDGSVVTWRHADFGGNSDKVKSEFQGIVFKVKANLPA